MQLLEPGIAYSPGLQEVHTLKVLTSALLNFPPGQCWQMALLFCEGSWPEVVYVPGPQTEQYVAPGEV